MLGDGDSNTCSSIICLVYSPIVHIDIHDKYFPIFDNSYFIARWACCIATTACALIGMLLIQRINFELRMCSSCLFPDATKSDFSGYCTLVLYFYAPVARENTVTHSCNTQTYCPFTHQIYFWANSKPGRAALWCQATDETG